METSREMKLNQSLESVGMQPEAEPSIAASVRSPRSTEITPERNLRRRSDCTEPEQATGTTGTTRTTGTTGTTGTAPTPLGGWQASESYGPSRTTNDRQSQYHFPHVLASQYLVNGDILAVHDEHNSKQETYLTGLHDDSQYTTNIPPSYTYFRTCFCGHSP